MDYYTYNLVSAIMFGILTFAAIFIPLFFSIKASNRTDSTLNEFIKIISGIDVKTKSILSEIKNSNKKQIEDALINFKDEIKPMLKETTDFPTIEALTQSTITGLTNSIDTSLNNIPFSGSAGRFQLKSTEELLREADDLLSTSGTDKKDKEKK